MSLHRKQAERVTQPFAREMRHLPQELKRTLTYDRGSEMARHQLVSQQAKVPVYFADPHGRGSEAPMRTPTASSDSSSPG